MSEASRRSALENMGAMGAAVVLGGPAARSATQSPGDPKPAAGQDKRLRDVSDLAIERFSKGHA